MKVCSQCGNSYDKGFEIILNGDRFFFDSFECAIHRLAPTCQHCGCRIIGHGVEMGQGILYCCAHCAREAGVSGLVDRTGGGM